ncbi:MAG: ComF family protein [Ignavibacteriae bacterium]|nr:ComF family protein [Ignavibacteriota bacterium]
MTDNSFVSTLTNVFIKPFQEIVFPPFCISCDVRLMKDESRICSDCWESFSKLDNDDSLYISTRERFQNDGTISDCLAPFSFVKEGTLQTVIHSLKYEGFTSMGIRLGEEIGKVIRSNEKFCRSDFLIPIPLHQLKRRERGYNQSEYICKGISTVTNIPVASSLLKRVRYTQSQTKLNQQERSENVTGAFRLASKWKTILKGKKVILVDDVVTTGATMRSCASELKYFGVGQIFSVSVAFA